MYYHALLGLNKLVKEIKCNALLVINVQVTFIIRTYFPRKNPNIIATDNSAGNDTIKAPTSNTSNE